MIAGAPERSRAQSGCAASVEKLDHRESVASIGIVIFSNATAAISMFLPKRNRRFIICRRLERYFANAVFPQSPLDFCQQCRADMQAPELRQHVNRYDVAAFVLARANAKPGNLAIHFGHHALRAAKSQIGAQLALRVGDLFFITKLIDFVKSLEILGRIVPKSDVHSRRSIPPGSPAV